MKIPLVLELAYQLNPLSIQQCWMRFLCKSYNINIWLMLASPANTHFSRLKIIPARASGMDQVACPIEFCSIKRKGKDFWLFFLTFKPFQPPQSPPPLGQFPKPKFLSPGQSISTGSINLREPYELQKNQLPLSKSKLARCGLSGFA